MKEIILLKSGEIALKGLNRSTFEDIMAKNARRRLQPLGEFKIWHAQSTTYVQPLTEGVDMDEAVRRLQTVFGIVAVTKSCVVEKDFSVICPVRAVSPSGPADGPCCCSPAVLIARWPAI